jgi:hypothetical protein
LKRRRSSDDPFNSTHGVALTLFAETLAGLAVFSRLGQKGKGILLKTETQYLKKAKGNTTRSSMDVDMSRDCRGFRGFWSRWERPYFGTCDMWSGYERWRRWRCGEG